MFKFSDEKYLINNYSTLHFTIKKLRKELKEQHEKFKIQELGYLDTIAVLQKKLRIYAENGPNKYFYNFSHKISKKNFLINSMSSPDNKKTNYLFDSNSSEGTGENKSEFNLLINKNFNSTKFNYSRREKSNKTARDKNKIISIRINYCLLIKI